MEKIAYDDEFFRFEKLYLAEEPVQVIAVHFARNGNPALPEMTGFAQVQVRQDQCFFFFPENAAFCSEYEVLIKKGMVEHK